MSTPLPLRAIQLSLGTLGRLAPGPAARLGIALSRRPLRYPRRPWEEAGLTAAESLRLPGPRGEAAAYEWRPTGSPSGTVLMLHGWEGRGSQFALLGPLLAARGLRAVAIEAPGHGQSPDGDGGPQEWIDTVRLAAEELGPLAGIAAHSLGCIASTVALDHGVAPERLAFFAPPAYLRPRMETAADRLGLRGAARERYVNLTVGRLLADGGRSDVTEIAARLAPPTLIQHAPDDVEVSIREGRALAASIAEVEFIETDAIGHYRILREPAVLERAANFLSRGAGPSPEPRPSLLSAR